jgi:hypothetical protein
MRRNRTTPPQPIPNLDDPSQSTVLIPLTRGKFAVVDLEDAERLCQFFWCAHCIRGRWYASGRVFNEDGWQKLMLMHRFIVDAPDGVLIDHEDNNALNNSRRNLRVATKAQNAANSRLRSDNKSGYRGVSWDDRKEKWRAVVRPKGRQVWIGYYDDPREAALAHDVVITEMFGAFARTNYLLGLVDTPPEATPDN